MKHTKTFLLTFSLLILFGCSPVRDEQVWIVVNNSSSEIYVEFTHNIYEETKLDTIASGEQMNVFYKEGIMQDEDMQSPTQLINMMITNNQDSLMNEENSDENWSVVSRKINKKGEEYHFDYTFEVENSDF